MTTPIRIVYDCSCKAHSQSPSLNQCMEAGPPMLSDLAGILLRFRVNNKAISSDIEKAFLHVGLDTCDRQYTKFLWLSDANNPDSDFMTYRFKSVLFGATCSPFILNAVIKTHLDKWDSDTANAIKQDIYVDNVLSSINGDATTYLNEANMIMKQAGFNLREISTNDTTLRDRAESDGILHPETTANLVGMKWNTVTDELGFKRNGDISELFTKREIVKRVASLYDPLGYLSPVHVKAKMLIQEIWKLNIDWDEYLPQDIVTKWREIDSDLNQATDIVLPRQYFPGNNTINDNDYELHCFADASMKGYGCAAYLVRGGKSSLVMAKNRVAPIKEITLPRLELMAAVIGGARLTKFVHNALASKVNVTHCTLWLDSQIVLCWLRSDKTLPCFVRNRVNEIHTVLPNTTFKYCPTQDNPADLLTRGINARKLNESELWWHGPTWLKNGDWPVSRLTTNTIVQDQQETAMVVNSAKLDTVTRTSGINVIIDVKRFSSLTSDSAE
ncbi:uncharacterized protein LOC144445271 [Glandiceps talaboti]